MLRLLLIFAALTVQARAQTQVAEPSRASGEKLTEKIVASFNKSKTLGEFLDQMGPRLTPEQNAFLKQKASSPGVRAVKLSAGPIVRGTTLISTGTTSVTFKVQGFDEKGHMQVEVNKRRVIYDPKAALSDLWSRIEATLPKISADWFAFVPRVWAFNFEESAAALAFTTNTVFATNEGYCNDIDWYRHHCVRGTIKLRALQDARALLNNYSPGFSAAGGCSDERKVLARCLKKYKPGLYRLIPAFMDKSVR